MAKKSLGFLIGTGLILLMAGVVLASPNNQFGKAKTPPFPQPAEKDLQKIVFVRYAPGKKPPATCNNNNVCDPKENWKDCSNDCPKGGNGEEPTPTPEETACYDFLSGAKPKWNWQEPYHYSDGLGSVSDWATDTWEASASAQIFGNSVSGAGVWGVYDEKNSILIGPYDEPGVLAVTAIWFRGKKIYEYDIIFDKEYFPNSDFDLATVVLHEFGHGAGLGDLYDATCSDEVMYWELAADQQKLVPGPGDTAGIQTLY